MNRVDNQIIPARVKWLQVIIFYVIAIGVSAPFRLNLIDMNSLLPLPEGLGIFYRVLRGIGPFAGFIVIYFLFKSDDTRRFSFWGINKRYSLLAMLVIPMGITIAGVFNDYGLEKNYFGMLTAMMLILYTLGEEYGWRGYLQQALAPLPLAFRIVAIAAFWFIWHLNFISQNLSTLQHFTFFIILILGSWGLMKISETTQSIAFTAGVHMSFNLLSDISCDARQKWMILGSAIIVWVILIRSIVKEQKSPSVSGPNTES